MWLSGTAHGAGPRPSKGCRILNALLWTFLSEKDNTAPSFPLDPNFPQPITPLCLHPPPPPPASLGLYLRGVGAGTGACIPAEPGLEAPILRGQSVAGAVFEGHVLVLGGTPPPALLAPTPLRLRWLHAPAPGQAWACLPPSSPQCSSLSLSPCLSPRRLGQHAHPPLFIAISPSHDPLTATSDLLGVETGVRAVRGRSWDVNLRDSPAGNSLSRASGTVPFLRGQEASSPEALVLYKYRPDQWKLLSMLPPPCSQSALDLHAVGPTCPLQHVDR